MKLKIISILSLITASTFAYAQAADSECWSEPLGYPCCQLKTTEIVFEEEATGYKFGVENDELCGITDLQLCPRGEKYKCCEKCNVYFVDDYLWGTQHGEWCSIKYSCEGKLVYKTTTTTTVADKPTAVEKTDAKTSTVAVKPTDEPPAGNPDPFGQQGSYPPQGGYPPPPGGYYPPQGGYYPPPQGGYYPPPQGGYYPPPQGGYYPPQGGYYAPPPPPPPPMYLGQPNDWCGGNGLPMICIYGYICSLNDDNYYQCLEDPNPEETQQYLLQIFPMGIPGYPGYSGNTTVATTVVEPATSVKQTPIAEPTTTVEQTTPAKSTTSVEPAKSTTSVEPAKSTTSVEPAKSTTSVEPAKSTTTEPTTSVKSTTTTEPEETVIVVVPNTTTTPSPAPTDANPGMWGWGMFPPFFGDPNNGNGDVWNPVWTNPMFGNPWGGFGNDNPNNNNNGGDNGNGDDNVPNLGDPDWGNTIWENPFIWGVGEDNGNGNGMPVWDPSIWGIPVWGDPSTWDNQVIDVEPVTTNDNNNNQDNQDLGIGPSGCVAFYYKCGGADFNGIKCCEPGSTCFQHNEYYHQCVPNNELYLYE